jgi:IS4 transposase
MPWKVSSRKAFEFERVRGQDVYSFQGRAGIFSIDLSTLLDKMRWEIELFFEWIKLNLKVKTFLGTSANAVKTQIWVALAVYLELAAIDKAVW